MQQKLLKISLMILVIKIKKKGDNTMTSEEMIKAKVNEYKILKKRALEVEDYFLAEYYDTLISDTTSEMIYNIAWDI